MKKFKLILLATMTVFVLGCSPKVKSVIVNKQPPLPGNENIALLDLFHSVPQGAIKVGELKMGDTGFSKNCDFNSLMKLAREKARESGANVAKVVEKIAPDNFTTTCYRLKFILYKYDGDVTKFPQYEITIL